MSKINHCIDCAHFKMKKFSIGGHHVPDRYRVLGQYAIMMACNRPALANELRPAEMERADGGQCGHDAKFFKSKSQ